MIIGIDASRSNVEQKTGTEYYSFEIIKNIVELENDNTLRLYCKTPLNYLKSKKNVEIRELHMARLWTQIKLSSEMKKDPPDVLFIPSHVIPLNHPKTVVTLHDVGFHYFPELYTPLERIYHHNSMKYSIKHAAKIIAISENTKNDLVKLYKADPKNITVIYHGYDTEKFYPARSSKKPAEIEKLGDYIYFIGRLEAKKNVKNLVRAYGDLREDKSITHKLVLAGRAGYQFEEILAEIESLPEDIRKDVILPGYIADEIMPEYLRYAQVFAFPSKFEGFGMPLVEAMACGIPIVASNTTSIPEIVGEAGLLFDPDNVGQIESSLKDVIKSKKIKDELIKKGFERLKLFNWKESARKTLEVIKSA